MEQLKGQDATFIYVENDVIKTHFTMVTIYDQSTVPGGTLRYRDVLHYFDEHIAGLPVFRCKLHCVPFELDAPYFVDDPNFHIESHVRHIALPRPGDWRQFCILAAQIQAQPIDMSKPLWDMTIIGGLDNIEGLPAGSFAILTRLHHAVADGTTARGILMALHHVAGHKALPLKPQPVRTRPSTLEMTARAISSNAHQIAAIPTRLLHILPGAGPTLANVGKAALAKALSKITGADNGDFARTKVPQTIFNGKMEYRRVFQMSQYPLAGIKKIRVLAENATLNDAVLAVIGGGMSRYLAASQEKADVDLFALCPINLREDKFSAESQLGNNISLMQVNLATRATDPAKRLARVVAATQAAKLDQTASTAKEIIALSRNAPNLLLAAGSRLAIAAAFRQGGAVRVANCIITNVPGPQEPLYFMGAKLVAFNGIGPVTSGTGPTFAVTSYLGMLTIGFCACPGWLKDPQVMRRCIDESYAELLAAAEDGKAGSKPAAKPKARPAAKPKTKPAARPAAKPKTKPAAKPAAKPKTKPAVKPKAKPTGAKPVKKGH